MFYDYHMHSSFSGDSNTEMEDMIRKSIDLGLKEICFTDHIDYDIISDVEFEVNLEKYIETINIFKNKYKDKISIKRGIEMGLQSHILDICSKDVHNYPFDFVIGSIHAIDRRDLYYGDFYKNQSQQKSYQKYYETLYNIVKNYNDYSIIGHLDIVKRYGDFDTIIDDKFFEDIIDSILKEIIYNGKGIEINTSCFRYNLPDLTPSTHILKRYKELGGEIITTGSDSHNPDQVAFKFDYIYSVLQNLGYKYISTFDNMKPSFIKL